MPIFCESIKPCCFCLSNGCARTVVQPSALSALPSTASIFCCSGQHFWFAESRKSPLDIRYTSLGLSGAGAFISTNSKTAYYIDPAEGMRDRQVALINTPLQRGGQESRTFQPF